MRSWRITAWCCRKTPATASMTAAAWAARSPLARGRTLMKNSAAWPQRRRHTSTDGSAITSDKSMDSLTPGVGSGQCSATTGSCKDQRTVGGIIAAGGNGRQEPGNGSERRAVAMLAKRQEESSCHTQEGPGQLLGWGSLAGVFAGWHWQLCLPVLRVPRSCASGQPVVFTYHPTPVSP